MSHNPPCAALTYDAAQVNSLLATDRDGFIACEEERYTLQVEHTAQAIADVTNGCQIVWMCGPSSVGKTTTAAMLCAALEARGVAAFVISLDDFYRGIGKADQLPDGRYDYESPQALDLPLLHRCLTELMTTGETMLPHFDFQTGAPAPTRTLLRVQGNTVILLEGIQAFSPLLTDGMDTTVLQHPLRLFINTVTRFTDGDNMLLCRRDIRLARRLLRDERTRNSDFAATLAMWQGVLAGDEKHIFPYSADADFIINTAMGYEPCVLAGLLRDRLSVLGGTPHETTAKRLAAAFSRFTPLSPDAVPADSILREFIG